MGEHLQNLQEVQRFLGIRPGTRQRRIGWLLLAICAVAVAAVLLRGQDFGRKFAGMIIYTTFERGYKLQAGSPVLLADVQVGEVDAINLDYVPFRIEVAMRIYPRFVESIPLGTEVGVELENIFERVVVLYPPDLDTGVAPKMLGKRSHLASRKASSLMTEAHTMIEAVGRELSGALHQVHVFTDSLNDPEGEFQQFMKNMREGSDKFATVTETLEKRMNDRSSVAGVVLNDERSAEDIRKAVENMKEATEQARVATENMEKASKKLPSLVENADEAAQKFSEVADQAKGSWILGGKGEAPERGKNW